MPITIQPHTIKNPISLIGEEAGVCWGADTTNQEKNYKRGLDCLNAGHGRTFEFPDVYMVLDDYSARVIREWYTHIGGGPTRLQESTRYKNFELGFDYVIPPNIEKDERAWQIYTDLMEQIANKINMLNILGIPKEDAAMCLPLGMSTKIVCKHNLRNLLDMARQRKCTRAYWEYRQLFSDLEKALSEYSEEWAFLVENYFKVKCDVTGYCEETYSCGRKPKVNKED